MRMHTNQPWVELYRPRVLDDIVGQQHVITKLKKFIHDKSIPHLLFAGSAGTGKTASAMALIHTVQGKSAKKGITYKELNASDARGIAVIRGEVKEFAEKTAEGVELKFIILDECDSMTKPAMQALRGIMEGKYAKSVRFILICNFSNKIIYPIQSRCSLQRFSALTDDQIRERLGFIAFQEGVPIEEDGINAIVYVARGDCRRAVNYLQAIANVNEQVTPEMVYQISGQINPEDIRNMLIQALGNRVENAWDQVFTFINSYGLSALNIVRQAHREILFVPVTETIKLAALNIIAEYEYRISRGGTEEIQLSSMIADLASLKD